MSTFKRVLVVCVLFGMKALSAWAGTLTCLSGTDPVVAGDAAQIAAVRAQIDVACPCSAFDGDHARYVGCAARKIHAAALAKQLRARCQSVVKGYYLGSLCGRNARLAPCLLKGSSGAVTCSFEFPGLCKGAACPGSSSCIEAGDTNHNGRLGVGDSGLCVSAAPTNTPVATPSATASPSAQPTASPQPTLTPTATATPVSIPVYCTDGIKDADETGVDCGGSCPPCSCAAAYAGHCWFLGAAGASCTATCTANSKIYDSATHSLDLTSCGAVLDVLGVAAGMTYASNSALTGCGLEMGFRVLEIQELADETIDGCRRACACK